MADLDRKIWRNYDWLYEHYNVRGMPYSQIAELVGRSKRAVILACQQFGIKSRTISDAVTKITPPPRAALQHAYCNEGLSQRQIAQRYGVTQAVVCRWMRSCGIPARRRDAARRLAAAHGKKPLAEWANPEWLMQQYETKSIAEIAAEVGWSYTFVHDLMASLDLPLRSSKDAMAMRSDKISAAMRERWRDPAYRAHMAKKIQAYPRVSSLQLKLYELLDRLGAEYYREYNEKENDPQCCVGYWNFDCVVLRDGRKTLLIECNGDYWHSLDAVIANDRQKAGFIAKYCSDQYELKYVWGHDFKNEERVLGLLRYWLHGDCASVEFNFGDLAIVDVDEKAAASLLGKYHYIGTVRRGSYNYGVMLGTELIAVGSFAPITRKQSASRLGLSHNELFEYSRFCIHPCYQKKNLATWATARFITRFRKANPHCKALISFADLSHNHTGGIYRAGNWVLDGAVPPVYWYVDAEDHIWHKKTVYSRAVAEGMVEREYAEQYGLVKVFGKEKMRYIYRL